MIYFITYYRKTNHGKVTHIHAHIRRHIRIRRHIKRTHMYTYTCIIQTDTRISTHTYCTNLAWKRHITRQTRKQVFNYNCSNLTNLRFCFFLSNPNAQKCIYLSCTVSFTMSRFLNPTSNLSPNFIFLNTEHVWTLITTHHHVVYAEASTV